MILSFFYRVRSFAINFISVLQILFLIPRWIWLRSRTNGTGAITRSFKATAPSLLTEPPTFEPGDTSDGGIERLTSQLYKPITINQIRLLELYSGKPDEPLRGYLRTKQFNSLVRDQAYEALSYVWGHLDRRRSIILNDKHFPISENLHTALQHLRSEVTNRTIWIDAICIDQTNKTERNGQVSIMGDIYKCARGVVNWLGPDTADTAVGIEALSYLFGKEDITIRPPWEKFTPEKLCAGLNDILKRDYFQRIWVVQENALAVKVTIQVGNQTVTWQCGAETYRAICRIKFTVISPAWDAFGLHEVDFRPLLEVLEQSMMITRKEMNKSCRAVTLLDQAFDMRYRKATDRRDMLFGLRSMAPEHIRERIIVDYEKPVDEVYADFFEEVKKAYMDEIQFVDEFEKERRRMEKIKEGKRQRYWGW